MPVFTDQTGRIIQLNQLPTRIVSLVPSQTELLYDLGLRDEVAGITKFCVHPEQWYKTKPRVGGTKLLNTESIRRLEPDLIIANKEENVKDQVEELEKHFPVWISDVNNLETALQMIRSVGELTGKQSPARKIISQIRDAFSKLPPSPKTLRAAYLIWQNPYMTVGGDTFIHAMMEAAGFENIFKQQSRYPVITTDTLRHARCEVLLLSSEPFPFKPMNAKTLQAELPQTRMILVDGEMFSWYGSRLILAPAYFTELQKQQLV